VLRTYSDAWVWRFGPDGVAAALRGKPSVVALPRQRQGEGIAAVGGRLVVDSEGAHTLVSVVSVPRHRTSSGTPTATPSIDRTTGAGDPSPSSGGHQGIRLLVIAGLLVAGLGALGTAVRVRRAR
jgi:hypothetical protein